MLRGAVFSRFVVLLLLFFLPLMTDAQSPSEANYEEEKVPPYELPDPLTFEDGSPVRSAAEWPRRRAELLSLFADHVYGNAPDTGGEITFEVRKTVPMFLEGKATLSEHRIFLLGEKEGPFADLLLITPNATKAAPTFLTLNFSGNHAINSAPEISLPESWMRMSADDQQSGRVIENRAQDAGRGAKASRWPVEKIIASGAALATIYYGDIDPDFDDGFENGVHATLGKPDGPHAWGSIATWAWGLSRAMDHLVTLPNVDASRV
ncbi:MAG: acetylxylan esterase, partial [Verrucomicrobiota bacterium]